jgi:hypothetical protein
MPDPSVSRGRSQVPVPSARVFFYDDFASSPGVMAVSLRGDGRMQSYQLGLKARGVSTAAVSAGQVTSRVIVGDQCFTATHACTAKARSLRCR